MIGPDLLFISQGPGLRVRLGKLGTAQSQPVEKVVPESQPMLCTLDSSASNQRKGRVPFSDGHKGAERASGSPIKSLSPVWSDGGTSGSHLWLLPWRLKSC